MDDERAVRTTIDLKPPAGLKILDGYDFDTFALEFDDDGALLDLRFELGAAYDFYWALPVTPNGRLRLVHVDSAVVHVDGPTVEEDPCGLSLAPLEWHAEDGGSLGKVAAGDGFHDVVAVFVRASPEPPLYRCVVEVRGGGGALRTFTLQNEIE